MLCHSSWVEELKAEALDFHGWQSSEGYKLICAVNHLDLNSWSEKLGYTIKAASDRKVSAYGLINWPRH